MARVRSVGIAAGIAAAFALAASWMLLERAPSGGGSTPRPAAPAHPVDDGAELVAPALPMRADAERELALPEVAAGAAERVEAPLAAGRPVRVVRAADGSPVAGAVVRYLGEREWAKTRWERPTSGRDAEWLLERFGRRFRADRDGRLFVPDGERATVDGAGPELWGWRALDADGESAGRGTEPIVLALERELVLRARVVDADGRPVEGADVVLGADQNGTAILRTVATGRDGRVRIVGADRRIERQAARSRISLAVDVVAWEPPRVVLDPAHLPEDEVELVVPPTGTVEVRFVDGEGALVSVDSSAALDVRDPAARSGSGGRSGSLRSARVTDGVARFPLVAVGASLRLHALSFDGRPPRFLDVEGPTRAGECVVVPVAVDTSLPMLVMHLERPDGSPLVDADVTLRMGDSRSDNLRRTDGAGRLTWIAWTRDANPPRALTLRAHDDGRLLRATVALPAPLRRGENDLGRVELALVTPFVAGRVLDANGEPVAGAGVVALERVGDAWRRLPQGATGSRADGGFALYGKFAGARHAVSASAPGWAESPRVAFAPPASGLELRLRSGGAIAGALLCGEAVAPGSVRLVLAGFDDGEARTWTASASMDGAFAFHDLPVGLYELSAVSQSDRTTLATVAGIAVAGGAETRDPRLAPWDLRGRFTRIALDVRDAAGARVDDLRAWWRRTGGEDAWTEIDVEASRVELITATPPLDVLLIAPGTDPLELQAVAASRDVVLKAGAPLELVLAGGMPALPPAVRLGVTIRTAAPDGGRMVLQSAEFDPHGVARVDVAPDRELELTVQPKSVLGFGSSVLRAPETITVPGAGARVVLNLDRERLERALQGLPR
jgi:hypothetical protein